MANYYGSERTNYVRLKNEKAELDFQLLVAIFGGEYVERFDKEGNRLCGALGNSEDGGFASSQDLAFVLKQRFVSPNPVSDLSADRLAQAQADDLEDVELNNGFLYEAHCLLAEGQVLIHLSAGAEKLRYICGYAEAISWTGESVTVSLDDIYEKAKTAFNLTESPTTASY